MSLSEWQVFRREAKRMSSRRQRQSRICSCGQSRRWETIFVPIIPAIVASGLLMGLLEGLCNLWPSMAESGTYQIFSSVQQYGFYIPAGADCRQRSKGFWRQSVSWSGHRHDYDSSRSDQRMVCGRNERGGDTDGIRLVRPSMTLTWWDIRDTLFR